MAFGDRDGSSRPAAGKGSDSVRWKGVTALYGTVSLPFFPKATLATHERITAVQEGWLCVHDYTPRIIKTQGNTFIQKCNANMTNCIIMRVASLFPVRYSYF